MQIRLLAWHPRLTGTPTARVRVGKFGLPTFCLGGLLSVALLGSAHAQVWKFVDQAGVLTFSNDRPSGVEATLLLGAPAMGTTAQAAASTLASSNEDTARAASRTAAWIMASPKYHAVKNDLETAAADHQLDVNLLVAVVAVESGFNPKAVSPKGAAGLMQLMPQTASRYGVKANSKDKLYDQLFFPQTNINAGSRYLADLLIQFKGQTELALAAYNAGENAVLRAGRRIPNYPETQAYVRKVTALHSQLTRGVVAKAF